MIYFLFVPSSGILHLPSEKMALLHEDWDVCINKSQQANFPDSVHGLLCSLVLENTCPCELDSSDVVFGINHQGDGFFLIKEMGMSKSW